ncbi:Vacuolar ATPase assembly integral membrane protein VMA21 [Termitomyces sp. J132]|nr:Vacuolar ATPase assembly integral membrane protein VMA21 [Termitomyces sp. J132]
MLKNAAHASFRSVLIKLILFSLSLGLVPITSFFASQRYMWNGNSTYAAITAVVSANIVLVAYIISSVLEDKGDTSQTMRKSTMDTKKQQ